MKKLTGKVAVVTGASKGIGAGIAKGLAEEGAAVVVNYASSREGAEHVVAEIKQRGGMAVRRTRRCVEGARCPTDLCGDQKSVSTAGRTREQCGCLPVRSP